MYDLIFRRKCFQGFFIFSNRQFKEAFMLLVLLTKLILHFYLEVLKQTKQNKNKFNLFILFSICFLIDIRTLTKVNFLFFLNQTGLTYSLPTFKMKWKEKNMWLDYLVLVVYFCNSRRVKQEKTVTQ